ncbi:triphosphoribosyl-dephospho-CoA synthase MdcB [Mycobacterium sp. GA-2829]|uniref:triphosphoribosyl-dephospho-CoA synthase MdcB n=1 Tax=Mycobacterium sp. GA-2829 TaxID=1772283 RepID=UPI000740384C|nr:triphosphoribosyl-dephospho-CoA synthase MdcB [Mycobacterium sp. GA-2829]KUI26904.1 triphosphoribosyl-dephospho-CoA synthase MdcB [Mycobacterium sp. GA-2829]
MTVLDIDTGLSAARIAAAAVRALRIEAVLTPKPGLVDLRGSASHPDMTVPLLLASADALALPLRDCVVAASELPVGLDLRARLGAVGRAGEERMLAVTGGVNTHRGALWALGLLAAGIAVCDTVAGGAAYAGRLAALPDVAAPDRPVSNGQRAHLRYGTGGARAEAAAGFPHVVRIGLPELVASRRRGDDPRDAALNALLAIMSRLDDTCVLHRGGPSALDFVHRSAALVLAAGGAATAVGRRRLERFCRDAELQDLSMGGSADLLAATLFCDLLTNGA